MDQSDKVQNRALERDAKCDSRAVTSVVLTATLSITGIGFSALPLKGGTVAERIDAIQNAVESGVIKLQPISPSGGAPLEGRLMAFGDNSAPKDEKKNPPGK